MSTAFKARPVKKVAQQFMPASHSLATGMLSAVFEDLYRILRTMGNLLLEIWLETVYSTSLLIQRHRD